MTYTSDNSRIDRKMRWSKLEHSKSRFRTRDSMFDASILVIREVYISIFITVNIMTNDDFFSQRVQMVKTQLIDRGIKDERVLDAMRKVPRHLFMPENFKQNAYEDSAFPIKYQL